MNPNVEMTLDDGVEEILSMLTGLDLQYEPDQDRYRSVARQINRALRSNALEKDWSYYSALETIGVAQEGDTEVFLRSTLRLRAVGDDSLRFVDEDGHIKGWAYILPRDALHKYEYKQGLWCSVTGRSVRFSRALNSGFNGMEIQAPVMREPLQFEIPKLPTDLSEPPEPVPDEVREQPIDFDYPDVIILRAAWQYAQSDPVMQPRVQTLEAMYKDLMYQLVERDDKNTDSPVMNEFILPMQGDIMGGPYGGDHFHPHSWVG